MPAVGEQFGETRAGVGEEAVEELLEPVQGIDLVEPTGLEEAEVDGGGVAATLAAAEQPVLAAQSQRADEVLGEVVVGPQPAVAEVALQRLALVQQVAEGLAQRRLGQRAHQQLLAPPEDLLHHRTGLGRAQRRAGVVAEGLGRRLHLVLLLVFAILWV